MFQLIPHHPYRRVPQAIDVSGFDIHSSVYQPGTTFSEDGREQGSGSLGFTTPACRIKLRPAGVFKKLTALKIEMVVRLTALGQRRNLIEGDSSFAFFIHPDGSLWGTSKRARDSGRSARLLRNQHRLSRRRSGGLKPVGHFDLHA